MNIKKIFLATLCISILCLLASLTDQISLAQDQPEVYLNNLPKPIVGTKQKLEVPIFFIAGTLADKNLEFYCWRKIHNDNSTEYLNSEYKWVTFSDPTEIQPLIQGSLPGYLYLDWIDPPRKEQEPLEYTLHVCIDSILDGRYPNDETQGKMTYACAAKEVIIKGLDCTPQDVSVDPPEISDQLSEGAQPPLHELSILDNCNNTVSCQVTSIPDFVKEPLKEDGGKLAVQFKNNQSLGIHSGNIILECPLGAGESVKKEIPVKLTVTSSNSCKNGIFFHINEGFQFPVPDGGQIPLSVMAGQTKSISLTCGQTEPLPDFEASVSGNRCFIVKKDISPGKYSKVEISPVSSIDCSDTLTVSSGTTSAKAIVKLIFQDKNSSPAYSLGLNPSDINETLSSGGNCDKKIYVTCNGRPVSSFLVTDPGKNWLRVGQKGQSSFDLNLNTDGLSEGDSDYADLKVSSESCGSRTLHVSLSVEWVCTPKETRLLNSKLSPSVVQGNNAASQSIKVEDNCGNLLDFEILGVDGNDLHWISSPKIGDTGSGTLTVNFDTASLPAGTYKGSITIKTSLGSAQLSIALTVGTNAGVSEAIPLTKGDSARKFSFGAGEVKLFKFRADSGPNKTLVVWTMVPSHYGNKEGNLHMMVKYAGQDWDYGPPTNNDYKNIQDKIKDDPYDYEGVYNNVYYYMTRSLTQCLEIKYPEEIENGCWYLWVKNIGGTSRNDCFVYFDY